MNLTSEDLRTIRRIVIRAVNEVFDVLEAAAQRHQARPERDEIQRKAAPDDDSTAGLLFVESVKTLYSIKETGVALGLSRSTIYSLIAQGRLGVVRIGSRTLVRVEGIRKLVEGNS